MPARLRACAFYAIMFGSGFLLSLWGLVVWRLTPRGLIKVPKFWARVTLAALRVCCGIRIAVTGLENLPAGGVIIAAQHQSELDIFIWLTTLKRPAIVFKKELRKIPLFGEMLTPAGMIEIDRAGGSTALRKLVADCAAAIAEGRQIVIFPEGTRTAPGTSVALQPGIAALAKTLGAPILPAATDTGLTWHNKTFAKSPGTAHVRVFPPLPPSLRRDELLAELSKIFYE